jgi:hypothetical protein
MQLMRLDGTPTTAERPFTKACSTAGSAINAAGSETSTTMETAIAACVVLVVSVCELLVRVTVETSVPLLTVTDAGVVLVLVWLWGGV